jgi:hypothetical protein
MSLTELTAYVTGRGLEIPPMLATNWIFFPLSPPVCEAISDRARE